jgi:serine/threonine protein kinase
MSGPEGAAKCLQSLVHEQIEAWRSGSQPDAAEFLAEHPELQQNKSLVLDLVLEEYCLRTAAGDTLVKSTFCDRFPAYRQSIVKMLEVHEFLDQCPQFAIDSQPKQWPQPGEHFLGYDVLEQLGSGALARVYLASEPALGRRLVVIKVSRFGAAEAETLGKLSHPNIVPVHSVKHDSVSGWTAICMPLLGTATAVDLLDAAFAEGQSRAAGLIVNVSGKRRTIASGGRPVEATPARKWRGTYSDAIAQLGLELADGLASAHAAGVLHHDIKPSNVLLAWCGTPMLLDFNLSSDEQSATERIGGTLPYMAPELIASFVAGRDRSAARLDPRCDVYSLGCVLYELLVGELPARPESPDKLPQDAYQPWLEAKRRPVAALRPHDAAIDAGLEAIVLKCLAADPAGRYASAAALAAALRDYLSVRLAAVRYVKQHRRGFLAAGAALALSSAAAGFYFGTRKPYPDRLLDRGLAAYERGDLEDALGAFDECNRLNLDWPEARFARAQTLLQMQRWEDASIDFGMLSSFQPGWSHALVGYCRMRGRQDVQALSSYRQAYRSGMRDLRLVFNFADALRRRGQFSEAVAVYSEVLRAQPLHAEARRGRARCYYCVAKALPRNRQVPDAQAFEDARIDIQLNPESYVPLYLAAIMCGYAVDVDPSLEGYREEGTHYLKLALQAGLPRMLYDADAARLDFLGNDEIETLLETAPALLDGKLELYHPEEFSKAADWQLFLAGSHSPPAIVMTPATLVDKH